VNGEEVLSASWFQTSTANITLSPGQHQVAIELENGSTGASGLMFSARRTADNVVIDRTDSGWFAASDWFGSPRSFVGYDTAFRPSPDI